MENKFSARLNNVALSRQQISGNDAMFGNVGIGTDTGVINVGDSMIIDGNAGTIDITNPGGHVDIKGVGGVWGSYKDRKGITLRSADRVGAERDAIDFNI